MGKRVNSRCSRSEKVRERLRVPMAHTITNSSTVHPCFWEYVTSVMPNTRRRRDSTVEFSRVGVGGVNTIRN